MKIKKCNHCGQLNNNHVNDCEHCKYPLYGSEQLDMSPGEIRDYEKTHFPAIQTPAYSPIASWLNILGWLSIAGGVMGFVLILVLFGKTSTAYLTNPLIYTTQVVWSWALGLLFSGLITGLMMQVLSKIYGAVYRIECQLIDAEK